MHSVDIYTDGAARGNPGNGGYGALLLFVDGEGNTHEMELSGGFENTTNNRMELLGVIEALEHLKFPCRVTIHSDSKYVCDAFNQHWVDSWLKRGWKGTNRKPVKNMDLWKRLLKAKEGHECTFVWVKGHAGHEFNERVDALATTAADSEELKVDTGYIEEV